MWITRERARDIARKILHTNDTPERTALAFAVGVGVGLSPLLGFHVLLALGLAFAFRLNRLAVLTGTLINNYFTMGPLIVAGASLGCLLTGAEPPDFSPPTTHIFLSPSAFFAFFGELFRDLWPLLGPFMLGSTVIAAVGGPAAYFLGLPIVRRLRARHEAHLAARAAAERQAAEQAPPPRVATGA